MSEKERVFQEAKAHLESVLDEKIKRAETIEAKVGEIAELLEIALNAMRDFDAIWLASYIEARAEKIGITVGSRK